MSGGSQHAGDKPKSGDKAEKADKRALLEPTGVPEKDARLIHLLEMELTLKAKKYTSDGESDLTLGREIEKKLAAFVMRCAIAAAHYHGRESPDLAQTCLSKAEEYGTETSPLREYAGSALSTARLFHTTYQELETLYTQFGYESRLDEAKEKTAYWGTRVKHEKKVQRLAKAKIAAILSPSPAPAPPPPPPGDGEGPPPASLRPDSPLFVSTGKLESLQGSGEAGAAGVPQPGDAGGAMLLEADAPVPPPAPLDPQLVLGGPLSETNPMLSPEATPALISLQEGAGLDTGSLPSPPPPQEGAGGVHLSQELQVSQTLSDTSAASGSCSDGEARAPKRRQRKKPRHRLQQEARQEGAEGVEGAGTSAGSATAPPPAQPGGGEDSFLTGFGGREGRRERHKRLAALKALSAASPPLPPPPPQSGSRVVEPPDLPSPPASPPPGAGGASPRGLEAEADSEPCLRKILKEEERRTTPDLGGHGVGVVLGPALPRSLLDEAVDSGLQGFEYLRVKTPPTGGAPILPDTRGGVWTAERRNEVTMCVAKGRDAQFRLLAKELGRFFTQDLVNGWLRVAAAAGAPTLISRLVTEYGGNPGCRDPRTGFTTLHESVRARQTRATDELIKLKAPLTSLDVRNRTPLHLACAVGDERACLSILAAAQASSSGGGGGGGGRGGATTLSTLFEADLYGNTPLHYAMGHDGMQAIQALLVKHGCLDVYFRENLPAVLWREAVARRGGGEAAAAPHPPSDDEVADEVRAILRDDSLKLLRAARDRQEGVALLLIHHASPDVGFTADAAPLHLAVANRMEGLIRVLLLKGAAVDPVSAAGQTPLHLASAIDADITKALLSAGANCGVEDRNGNLPLHYACRAGKVPVALMLINRGRRYLDYANHGGTTALHLAVCGGHHEVVSALITRKADLDAADHLGNTSLHCACSGRLPACAAALIHAGANLDVLNHAGYPPLLYACSNAMSDVAVQLLKRGCDPNAHDRLGQSVFHYACANSLELVCWELLRIPSVDICKRTKRGVSVLQLAAASNLRSVAETLLTRGSNIDAVDRLGNTCLHYACLHQCADTAESLIASGANPHAVNSAGKTPVDYVMLASGPAFVPPPSKATTRHYADDYLPAWRRRDNSDSFSAANPDTAKAPEEQLGGGDGGTPGVGGSPGSDGGWGVAADAASDTSDGVGSVSATGTPSLGGTPMSLPASAGAGCSLSPADLSISESPVEVARSPISLPARAPLPFRASITPQDTVLHGRRTFNASLGREGGGNASRPSSGAHTQPRPGSQASRTTGGLPQQSSDLDDCLEEALHSRQSIRRVSSAEMMRLAEWQGGGGGGGGSAGDAVAEVGEVAVSRGGSDPQRSCGSVRSGVEQLQGEATGDVSDPDL